MAKYAAKSKIITVTTGSEYTWPGKFHGRKITFKVHPIKGGLQVMRGGRRGGIRGEGKARGGVIVCTPAYGGDTKHSKCVRAKDVFIFPGGGAKMRRAGAQVLNGLRGRRRRRQRR